MKTDWMIVYVQVEAASFPKLSIRLLYMVWGLLELQQLLMWCCKAEGCKSTWIQHLEKLKNEQ